MVALNSTDCELQLRNGIEIHLILCNQFLLIHIDFTDYNVSLITTCLWLLSIFFNLVKILMPRIFWWTYIYLMRTPNTELTKIWLLFQFFNTAQKLIHLWEIRISYYLCHILKLNEMISFYIIERNKKTTLEQNNSFVNCPLIRNSISMNNR